MNKNLECTAQDMEFLKAHADIIVFGLIVLLIVAIVFYAINDPGYWIKHRIYTGRIGRCHRHDGYWYRDMKYYKFPLWKMDGKDFNRYCSKRDGFWFLYW